MGLDPQRIAEIRAAWAADRASRLAHIRRNWPWLLLEIVRQTGIAMAAVLAMAIYAIHHIGGGI